MGTLPGMTTLFAARSPNRLLVTCLVTTVAACGSVTDNPASPDAGSQVPPDGAVSVPPDGAPPIARCRPAEPFGTPTPVAGVNTDDDEIGFALTRDELTGFVTRVVQDTPPSAILLAAKRTALADPFGTPTQDATSSLNAVDGDELFPFPSNDALTLYFSRTISSGDPRLLTAARASVGAAFRSEAPVQLDGSPLVGRSALPSADGETLYWVDTSSTLHSASRGSAPGEFITQRDLSQDEVASPVLSTDELTVYYANSGVAGILVATRASRSDEFGAATVLAGLDSIAGDAPVFLTSDGCVLYLKSNRPGGRGGDDLWQAQRPR